jgi:hypothetical protein
MRTRVYLSGACDTPLYVPGVRKASGTGAPSGRSGKLPTREGTGREDGYDDRRVSAPNRGDPCGGSIGALARHSKPARPRRGLHPRRRVARQLDLRAPRRPQHRLSLKRPPNPAGGGQRRNVRSFRGAGPRVRASRSPRTGSACEPGTHKHGPVNTVDGPVFIGSGRGPPGHPGMT